MPAITWGIGTIIALIILIICVLLLILGSISAELDSGMSKPILFMIGGLALARLT